MGNSIGVRGEGLVRYDVWLCERESHAGGIGR